MKKWFAYGTVFFSVYLVFLIATLPVSWLVTYVKLPSNMQITELAGTVWESNAEYIEFSGTRINKVSSELSFFSLLMFDPTVSITFGGALMSGPEGKLTASQLFNDIKISELKISLPANNIAEKLSLPIPVEAHNFIDLTISEFVMGQPICQQLSGTLLWKKAAVTALSEKVKLGRLSADLSCEKGALALTVSPKNDLGLTFTTYVHNMKKASGNGFLKPSVKFPAAIRPLLSFLGKADNQGRYRLSF
ncbi:MAG: type II secretion system protein N [Colwellia sp.]|nr:type II secretion system protein N [Colwellia sp.]